MTVHRNEVNAAQAMHDAINVLSIEMLTEVSEVINGNPTALIRGNEQYLHAGIFALFLSTLSSAIDEIKDGNDDDPMITLEKLFTLGAFLLGNATGKGIPSVESLLEGDDIPIEDD